jgi:cyclase
MQRRIQRALRHLHHIAGDPLQPQCDGVPVDRAERGDFQDQQVKSALGEIGFRCQLDTSFFYRLTPLYVEEQGVAGGGFYSGLLAAAKGRGSSPGCWSRGRGSFDILPRMRTRSLIRLTAALLLAGGLWLAHTQQNGPPPSKLDLVKIKDDLYVIHNDLVPGNSTALITNDGVILVDDKFDVDYDGIMAQLKKVTSKPVKYVINTHHHGDHSGGNAKMQKMDVQIVASRQARENMVDGNQPGLPNVVFDHQSDVFLGGKVAKLYHFGRAHTNGDIVVLFPAERTLAAGDMFTFGKDVPELIDYAGGGSGKEWTSTLDSALMLPFDTVVPGHGPVTTRAEMAKFRETTVALRNRVHGMVVQKKSRDEVAAMLKKEYNFAQLHLDRSLDGLMVEMQ